MTEPAVTPHDEPQWTTLTAPQKRARVLQVAGVMFAREGVDFPMPELAKAVGIGVGSLYRQIGTKDDVLAELVIDRLQRFQTTFDAAALRDDPVEALFDAFQETVTLTMQDRVAKISFELGLDRDDVREVRAKTAATLERLVDRAKAAGGVRADASAMDLRMTFRLAREAERLSPGGGQRIADLVMAGLRSV
jgi:AcrR family transcriptional regulator